MKWEKVKLKEVLDNIVGGGTPSKLNLNYWGGDICWCSVKDMSFDTHYLSSTKDTITEEGLKNSTSNLIKQGTVITATRMGLGRVFINKVDMAINQDLKALIPNKKIDNLFLLWTIIYKREEILSMGRGATVNGITLDMLTDIQIALPPLNVQGKIANTMSTYDDLIENNQKQIKLLEEAAQRLYKEWFVDFRFPGYENAKFIDGIPEGWRKAKLNDVLAKITTGLNPRKNFVLGSGENYYVTIKNMKDNNIYLDDKCDRIDDEALIKINKRSDLQKGDILFSGIGTMGRVYLIGIPTDNWNVSESVFTMRANDNISKEMLYLLLLSPDMQGYCDTHAHGVAQRGIRMADIKNYQFYLPVSEIIENFTNNAKPFTKKIQILQRQNILLTQARDRLLPKLMSGEIEV